MLDMQMSGDNSTRIGETQFLPSHSFYEFHASEPIDAAPKDMIEAVANLNMRDDKVADFMMGLRDFPSRIRDRVFNVSDAEKQPEFGFDTFTLLKRDDREISLGLIGKFWNPFLNLRETNGLDEFCAFKDTTMAKLVLRFLVIENDGKLPHLVTETFIYCPNHRTKLFFTPYWLAIRLISGWLRKRTLRTIRQNLGNRQANAGCGRFPTPDK